MDKNKYIVKRFLDLIFGVMLSFLFMFGKRKNRIIFNSVLNKNFDNNSKYYFLYLLRNHCKYELKFVVNDDRQRTDAISRYGEHFITSRGIKNKIYILNAKYWITSSLETPVGGVFLRKNRKVINLGHGMPYKLVGLQERNLSKLKKVYYKLINTNFDYFLSTTEFYSSVIQKSFGCNADRVIIAPQPRMSALKNEFLDLHRTEIFKNNKNILYAPTWRRNGKLKLFTFWSNISSLDDFLVKHETVIWLRLHPHFEFDTDISSLRNIRLFSGKEYPDINQYLYVFDGLITDYSSVFLDFLFFNRPIYFSEYDKKEYINDNGIISNSGKVKPENPLLNEIDFQEMLYQINRGNSVNYTEFNKNANYVIDNENDDNCRVLHEILNSKFY